MSDYASMQIKAAYGDRVLPPRTKSVLAFMMSQNYSMAREFCNSECLEHLNQVDADLIVTLLEKKMPTYTQWLRQVIAAWSTKDLDLAGQILKSEIDRLKPYQITWLLAIKARLLQP